jgi:hypothetical protein
MTFPSIKSKSNGGGADFDPVPAGTHFAYCTQLIDLGTQLETYQGEEKEQKKLYIRFEVPEERLKYKKDGVEVEGPMTIGMQITNSLGQKSKLRPMLESWRGKPFTEDELQGFELTSIVGKPCQISVSHVQRKDGQGVSARITAILGIHKLQREAISLAKLPGQPEGELLVYTPEAHDKAVFEKLPNWIQEKIGQRVVTSKPEAAKPVEDFNDNLDEIPF